jgi:DNA-binding transcriptional regulator YhcF (GntR family)
MDDSCIQCAREVGNSRPPSRSSKPTLRKSAKKKTFYTIMPPRFPVDRKCAKSMVAQVTDQLTEMIKNGTLKPGKILPGARVMATRLHIDRNIIVRSYLYLKSSGLIHSLGHKGWVVMDPEDSGKKKGEANNNGNVDNHEQSAQFRSHNLPKPIPPTSPTANMQSTRD